jgi:pantothenate kinase type III
MQGLVTLDFGNTNPSAGLFQKNQGQWNLIKIVPLAELSLFLTQLQMNANNTSVVVSEVKPREEEITKLQEQGFLVTRVRDYWRGIKFAGMPVHYAQTLGEDRLITAFYVFKKDKTPTLLIDAGTFVTMDVVTQNGFEGGYIVPGISSYFKSFADGELLKDVPLAPNFENKLPQETAQALINGYQAFAALAKEMIQKHSLKKLILTGGSGELWKDFFENLSSDVVVENQANLVHLALHYWMTTQIEPL